MVDLRDDREPDAVGPLRSEPLQQLFDCGGVCSLIFV
jgi:hypothetical protein